jgi:hypothetical protein
MARHGGHRTGRFVLPIAAPLNRDAAKSCSKAVTCHVVVTGDVSGVSAGGGRDLGGTMEVPTLTIARHEGRPPADDIFAYPGCPQPASPRSPCAGPGPAEEARPPAPAGRAAGRRDRGCDRGGAVVRRDGQWAADAGPEALAVLEESTFRRRPGPGICSPRSRGSRRPGSGTADRYGCSSGARWRRCCAWRSWPWSEASRSLPRWSWR